MPRCIHGGVRNRRSDTEDLKKKKKFVSLFSFLPTYFSSQNLLIIAVEDDKQILEKKHSTGTSQENQLFYIYQK